MSESFSSSSTAALFRFIGALFVSLFCFSGVGFFIWGSLTIGSPWVLTAFMGTLLTAMGTIFAKGTYDNWFDYKRIKMLEAHGGSLEDILAGQLVRYWVEQGKPNNLWFDSLFHWLDEQKSSLDTGNILDALKALEQADELTLFYPPDGGLMISLKPSFHRRAIVGIAPQRRD